MSDAIFVRGLALHAYHGVIQHEAKVGQTFRLDIDLDIDLAAASRSDKLKDTVSYDMVVKTVSEASARDATGWSRRQPGRWPKPCSSAARTFVRCALPCTNRTPRSPRRSTMSA